MDTRLKSISKLEVIKTQILEDNGENLELVTYWIDLETKTMAIVAKEKIERKDEKKN